MAVRIVVYVRSKRRNRPDHLTPVGGSVGFLSLGERSSHPALVLVRHCNQPLSDHGSSPAARDIYRQSATKHLATSLVVLFLQRPLAKSHTGSATQDQFGRLHCCHAGICRSPGRHSGHAWLPRRDVYPSGFLAISARLGSAYASQ